MRTSAATNQKSRERSPRPIRSVVRTSAGPIRSVVQSAGPIRSVVRTSASTNQERRANNCLDQSEEFHEAEKKQRRRRSTNQTSSGREHWRTPRHARRTDFLRTNFVSSDSSPSENHGSANQIPTSEYFGRTFFGRTFFGLIPFLQILDQLRTTDQPIRSLHRSNSDGLSSDGLSSG